MFHSHIRSPTSEAASLDINGVTNYTTNKVFTEYQIHSNDNFSFYCSALLQYNSEAYINLLKPCGFFPYHQV